MTVSSVPPRRPVRLQVHRMRDPLDARAALDAALTPAERGRIVVDDAPFVAVAAERHGTGPDQTVVFRTNLDETVAADADHPVLVRGDGGTGAPRPYIVVRDGLEARIGRPVFYDLVEWAEVAADGSGIGVWSGGTFFPLGRIDPD